MKCLIVIVILAVAVNGLKSTNSNQILEAFNVCGKEANIPEDSQLNVDEATYDCIVKCVYTKLLIHDAEGKVVMPELEKILNRKFTDDQKNKINDCEEKYKDEGLCRKVARTQSCIAKIFHNVE